MNQKGKEARALVPTVQYFFLALKNHEMASKQNATVFDAVVVGGLPIQEACIIRDDVKRMIYQVPVPVPDIF